MGSAERDLSKLITMALLAVILFYVMWFVLVVLLTAAGVLLNFIAATFFFLLVFRRGVGHLRLSFHLFWMVIAAAFLAGMAMNGGTSELQFIEYSVPGQRGIYWFYVPTLLLLAYNKFRPGWSDSSGGDGWSWGVPWYVKWLPLKSNAEAVRFEVAFCIVAGMALWYVDGSAAIFCWLGGLGLALMSARRRERRQQIESDLNYARQEAENLNYRPNGPQRHDDFHDVE